MVWLQGSLAQLFATECVKGCRMKSYEETVGVSEESPPITKPRHRDAPYIKPVTGLVLQPLAQFCHCELVVSEAGAAMVLYTKTLPEGIHWAEYDVDLSLLTFVTWSGSIMELGMKVHAPFRKYLKQSEEIMMVQLSEDKKDLVVAYPADLVTRDVGI